MICASLESSTVSSKQMVTLGACLVPVDCKKSVSLNRERIDSYFDKRKKFVAQELFLLVNGFAF